MRLSTLLPGSSGPVANIQMSQLSQEVQDALTGIGLSVIGTVTVPASTAGDDTAVIQSNINAASLMGANCKIGEYIELKFQSDEYFIGGLEWKSNVFFNFGNAIFTKHHASTTLIENGMIRTVATNTNGSFYGKYFNIRTRGGVFHSNNFLNPASIVLLENVEDAVIEDITVRHSKPPYTSYGLTVAPTAGATSATLSSAWTGTTGNIDVLFASDEVKKVLVTNGSTAVTWAEGLIHDAGSASFEKIIPSGWGLSLGGHRIRVINPTILGGLWLFQDGVHITNGRDITVIGGYVQSGDDPLAVGIDAAGAENFDDEGIKNVTFIGTVVNAKFGSLKVYYGLNTSTGQPFSGQNRGKIDGVVFVGITGTVGSRANGGIYVVDTQMQVLASLPQAGATSATLAVPWTGTSGIYWLGFSGADNRPVTLTNGSTSAPFAFAEFGLGAAVALGTAATSLSAACVDPGRIKNITVDSCVLTVGTSDSNGENSNGIYAMACTNLTVTGTTLNLYDIPHANGMAAGRCSLVMGGVFSVNVPAMPSAAGFSFTDCINIKGRDATTTGGAGAGRGIFELSGVQQFAVHDWTFDKLTTGTTGVLFQSVGSGVFYNSANIHDNNATKAFGATLTRFVGGQSANAGFIKQARLVGNDIRGTSNATAVDAINSTVGWAPDEATYDDNRGFGGALSKTLVGSGTALTGSWGGTTAVTPSAMQSNRLTLTLAGNTTIGVPTGAVAGTLLEFTFTQDATGSRAVSWSNAYKFYVSPFPAPGAAGTKCKIRFRFDGVEWIQESSAIWI